MIDKANKSIKVNKQCDLLGINKSTYYYKPKGESKENIRLMEKIDREHTNKPHLGVRMMTTWLRLDEVEQVNTKRIQRLYKKMDIYGMVPGPHTSKGNKSHKTYPYLLRGLNITKSNQVWATDITYIPVKDGFMYLVAIIDVYSRYVLEWSLSNTMTSEWCSEILVKCIDKHGVPEIFNTDQGSQFTSEIFTDVLKNNKIKISMDGKGRATDNIFIERLWRSVKYENIYLNSYSTGLELKQGLVEYFKYYNTERRHSSIENSKPIEYYKLSLVS